MCDDTAQTRSGSEGPPLETERLILRRWRADDAGPLLAIVGDAEVMRWVGGGTPCDLERLAASQKVVEEHWREHGYGPLAVVERASGRLVGEAGLQLLEGGPSVELTYTFAKAVWGRGYATEAGRAVLRWAFGPLALEQVAAVLHTDNLASRRVVEKLGFRHSGRGLHYGRLLLEFELGREEWRARLY